MTKPKTVSNAGWRPFTIELMESPRERKTNRRRALPRVFCRWLTRPLPKVAEGLRNLVLYRIMREYEAEVMGAFKVE